MNETLSPAPRSPAPEGDWTTMDPLPAMQAWLQRAVIGLNLCPFAKGVQQKGQIRWVLSEARTVEALVGELLQELKTLAAADPDTIDTTVLVHPQVLQNFADFNDFLEIADEAVAELDLEGTLQVASFHPDFQFADTDPDDVTNATNRSPFPALHLLREASIDRAVAAFPEAEAIYERNIETLERLGPDGWARLVRGDTPT